MKVAEVKQTLKRREVLQRQLETMMVDQFVPPTGPGIRRVTDEQAMDLLEKYKRAHDAGQGKESDFQPLHTYMHKLTTKSGKEVRPIFSGEVGMIGSEIIVLEPGYGTGSQSQVPGDES